MSKKFRTQEALSIHTQKHWETILSPQVSVLEKYCGFQVLTHDIFIKKTHREARIRRRIEPQPRQIQCSPSSLQTLCYNIQIENWRLTICSYISHDQLEPLRVVGKDVQTIGRYLFEWLHGVKWKDLAPSVENMQTDLKLPEGIWESNASMVGVEALLLRPNFTSSPYFL